MQDLYHCLTVFSEWGVPYLLHATLCCSLYSYGAITGCLHYFGESALALPWRRGLQQAAQTLHHASSCAGAEFLLWEASTVRSPRRLSEMSLFQQAQRHLY
jgi:hypothetical protein